MKYLKKYNESIISNEDFEYHYRVIEDALQEIIDEYSIYEFNLGDSLGGKGWIYYIALLDDVFPRQEIRLEISTLGDGGNTIDLNGKDFISFEGRLKSMGYKLFKNINKNVKGIDWVYYTIHV